MRTLHAIFTLLLLIAIGLFVFDLIYHWAVYGKIEVISVAHLWQSVSKTGYTNTTSYAERFMPSQTWEMFTHAPAQIVLLGVAAILYLPLLIMKLFTKKED